MINDKYKEIMQQAFEESDYGLNISDAKFINLQLIGESIEVLNVSKSIFQDCTFEKSKFLTDYEELRDGSVVIEAEGRCNAKWTEFFKSSFIKCEMPYMDFSMAKFIKTDVKECIMHNCIFINSDLSNIIFEHCDLHGSDFRRANLQGTRFIECNLKECFFHDAHFHETVLSMWGSNLIISEAML